MRNFSSTVCGASLILLNALLSGCYSAPLDERLATDRAQYQAYAGPPVEQFTYLFNSRDNGWRPLSATELVVWTSPYEVYLLKVAEPCDDLRFARRVDVTSSTGMNSIQVRIDFVKVGRFHCPITEIRPVDTNRMRAELHKQVP